MIRLSLTMQIEQNNLFTNDYYSCSSCDAKNCKLWRMSGDYSPRKKLFCLQCMALRLNIPQEKITEIMASDQEYVFSGYIPAIPDTHHLHFQILHYMYEEDLQAWLQLP